MTYIILLFGILILSGGALLIFKPDSIFSQFKRYGDSLGLHVFAVIVRIILGIALVIGAAESRYPVVLQILGWLTISAALVLSMIGRERFKGLINWAVGIKPLFQRLMGILAVLFGCFLVYAVI